MNTLSVTVHSEDQELAARVSAYLVLVFRKFGRHPAVTSADLVRINQLGADEWTLTNTIAAAIAEDKVSMVTVHDNPLVPSLVRLDDAASVLRAIGAPTQLEPAAPPIQGGTTSEGPASPISTTDGAVPGVVV
jgi:hypothetical protein